MPCESCLSYSNRLNQCLRDKANPETAKQTYKAIRQGIPVCTNNDWLRDIQKFFKTIAS